MLLVGQNLDTPTLNWYDFQNRMLSSLGQRQGSHQKWSWSAEAGAECNDLSHLLFLDVAVEIGMENQVEYLVLQVHYRRAFTGMASRWVWGYYWRMWYIENDIHVCGKITKSWENVFVRMPNMFTGYNAPPSPHPHTPPPPPHTHSRKKSCWKILTLPAVFHFHLPLIKPEFVPRDCH